MKRLLIFFFLSGQAFALTEQDVVQSVLENFPLIHEAYLKEKAATEEVISAQGAFDHKLVFKSINRFEEKYDNQYFESYLERQTALGGMKVVAGHRQGTGDFPSYYGKYETSGAGEIFAGLSLPILRNFKTDEIRTNLKVKVLEKKQLELQISLKKMTYLHKALSLYYKWILEIQKLRVNNDLLKLAKSRHEMLKAKFKAGDVERVRVTDNQRAIDKRKSETLKSEIELSKIRAEMSVYLRDKQGRPIFVPIEVDPKSFDEENKLGGLTFDYSRNPQLQILELEKEKLEAEKILFKQSRLPGLNVELLGAKELSSNRPYDKDRVEIGVKFDFPLENRKAEGKSVAYEYKVRSIEKNREFMENEISQQLQFYIKASSHSRERWQVIMSELAGTKKMADAEKKRWLQGASDLFVVNIREQDVADVEVRRWSALYDYHQYRLDARLFSGRILDNDQ